MIKNVTFSNNFFRTDLADENVRSIFRVDYWGKKAFLRIIFRPDKYLRFSRWINSQWLFWYTMLGLLSVKENFFLLVSVYVKFAKFIRLCVAKPLLHFLVSSSFWIILCQISSHIYIWIASKCGFMCRKLKQFNILVNILLVHAHFQRYS